METRSVVAITGASSGIGAVFARRLAPEHNLLLIARRADKLNQLAAELNSEYGTQSEIVQADLTADRDLTAVADRLATHPNLVLLINNAGFGAKGLFWRSPLEVQEAMHRLHVMATVRLTHAALRNLVARDRGGIINVASVSAFVRNAGSVSYGATKSWMTSFTEGLYLELSAVGSHVTVQALCPGFTYSEFHDRMEVNRQHLASGPFWMTAEEVVKASIEGLAQRKLFVIPGWRYRLLTTFLTKIPTPLRLYVERVATRSRQRAMGIEGPANRQIPSAK
ncbi:MAG TPA: SDR family NAD(P)-dependent oxidoreductase [Bryobacteraceae bacterium]|nr:SDR family NAD(P)-dependent oxidoreductase [Bryobacteraceae bacterium]